MKLKQAKMESKEKKTIPNKEQPLKKTYHKIPSDVFNATIQQLLTAQCKLADGINLLNALKKAEIISE